MYKSEPQKCEQEVYHKKHFTTLHRFYFVKEGALLKNLKFNLELRLDFNLITHKHTDTWIHDEFTCYM